MPVRVFPVDASARVKFEDEFGVQTKGRTHEGTDIFAARGTRVFAVDDGHAAFGTNQLGGNIARLIVDDGTTYYYAHLQDVVGESRDVKAGELIGHVGNTGNARDTSPHLHFGIYPPGHGTPAIDPFPALAAAAERAAKTEPAPPRVPPQIFPPAFPSSGTPKKFGWLILALILMNKNRTA